LACNYGHVECVNIDLTMILIQRPLLAESGPLTAKLLRGCC
jgi:hypothetical protein